MFCELKQKILYLLKPSTFFKKNRPVPSSGQTLTEYVIILGVAFPIGLAAADVFEDVRNLDQIFYNFYISLADYLNLTYF